MVDELRGWAHNHKVVLRRKMDLGGKKPSEGQKVGNGSAEERVKDPHVAALTRRKEFNFDKVLPGDLTRDRRRNHQNVIRGGHHQKKKDGFLARFVFTHPLFLTGVIVIVKY